MTLIRGEGKSTPKQDRQTSFLPCRLWQCSVLHGQASFFSVLHILPSLQLRESKITLLGICYAELRVVTSMECRLQHAQTGSCKCHFVLFCMVTYCLQNQHTSQKHASPQQLRAFAAHFCFAVCTDVPLHPSIESHHNLLLYPSRC